MSNASQELEKKQVKAKHHPEVEHLIIRFLHPYYHSKITGRDTVKTSVSVLIRLFD